MYDLICIPGQILETTKQVTLDLLAKQRIVCVMCVIRVQTAVSLPLSKILPRSATRCA